MRLLIVLLINLVAGQVDYPSYVTFPQQVAPITVLQGDPEDSRLSKGYWFLSPFYNDASTLAFGPQIVDNYGRLVWNGNASIQWRGHSAHICAFRSAELNTICFNDAATRAGHSIGTVKFVSSGYEQVAEYGAANGLFPPDNHELEAPSVTNGDTFIQQVFQPTTVDLSGYGGPEEGYILAGCFQERSSFTGNVEFQWCSYPTIPLDKTYVYMKDQTTNITNNIGGDGTEYHGWDYAHMNAVSRTDEGDYIISCRHLNAIFSIAGNNSTSGQDPGSVLWQLGGKDPTIKSDSFTFSKQHAVRWRGTKGNTTLITLFDNATDGVSGTNTSDMASGKEILVDTETKVATLVHKYDMPNGRLSSAQGMMQWLDNGNVAVGWGRVGYYSEFTRDGELLYHAQYAEGSLQSYRIWKFPWHATPTYPPSLVLYAQTCDAQLYAYASWNGATDVVSFRFYKGSTPSGPWQLVSTDAKTDFEVRSDLNGFALFGYVEALDSNGGVIGTSAVTKVFVPVLSMANCTAISCEKGTDYSVASSSAADECVANPSNSKNTDTTAEGAIGLLRENELRSSWYNLLSGGLDSLVWPLFFLTASFAMCYMFYMVYITIRPRSAAPVLK